MDSKKYFPFLAILALAVLLILFSNIKGVLYNCFHAYDFGIYQQGIFNLASGESLNPFLTVRGISTFNDHFMPVLFLAIPFVWISNFHPLGLVVFEWLWLVTFLLVVWKTLKNRNFSSKEILASLFLIVFSKGILTGLEFPIHPGTWSMPIWYLLILNIYEDKKKKVVLFSIILCMFREAYPFGVLLLGIYYFFRKHFVTGSALTVFSSLYLFFVLSLRPKILGPTADYGGKLLKGLVNDPFVFLGNVFSNFEILVVLKLFSPIIILFAFIFYKQKGKIPAWSVGSLCLILPLFGIHFLTNQYHFHYGPAFMAPLLSIAFLSTGYRKILENKKILYVVGILFIATASGRYTKFFNNLVLSKNNKCTFESDYFQESEKVQKFFKALSLENTVVASGGVIQSILKPGLKVYPPDTMVELPENFDVLLLLRNGAGDTYPWHKEHVEKAVEKCKPNVSKVILESKNYFLAEGKFNKSCLAVWP